MRWRFSVAGFLAASVAVTGEAVINAMFAYGFGHRWPVEVAGIPLNVEGVAYATVAAGLALGQAHAASLCLHDPAERRGSTLIILLVCASCSIAALVMHFNESRLIGLAEEQRGRRAWDDADRALTKLETEAATLGKPRALGVVDAAVAAVPIGADVIKETKFCRQDMDKSRANRNACGPVLELYEERARREALDKLEPKIAAARAARDIEARPPEVDAVSRWLSAARPWLLALGVETMALLGFGLVWRRVPVDAPPEPQREPVAPVEPVQAPKAAPAPRAQRTAPPPANDNLLELLEGIAAGKVAATGCIVQADGWINAPQTALAHLLGCSAPTVGRRLSALEAAGRVSRKSTTQGTLVRIIYPTPAVSVVCASP